MAARRRRRRYVRRASRRLERRCQLQALQLVLPTIAIVALGTALLVPLRDDRRGKRATIGSAGSPLQLSFAAVAARVDERLRTDCDDDVTSRGAAEASASLGCEDEGRLAGLASSQTLNEAATTAATEPVAPDASRTTLRKFAAVLLRPARADRASEIGVAAPHGESVATDESTSGGAQSAAPIRGVAGIFATVMRGAFRSDPDPSHEAPQLLAGAQPCAPSSADDILCERSFASKLAELVGPARQETPSWPEPHLFTPSPAEDGKSEMRSIETDAGVPRDEQMGPLVLQAAHGAVDRVLPLTRLPLRAQIDTISWPSRVATPREMKTRDDRHALLEALERSGDASAETALLEAYRQEDALGRLLALRALMHGKFARAGSVFREALRSGTDDERGLAVDALAGLGDRDGVTAALCDRIDAVAAKAALAHVGIATREAYRTALAPHIEAARIEVILDLLAGIIE